MTRRSTIDLGHDAFLDIVANLVGILIILVVVLGSQTQQIQQAVLNESQVPTKPVSVATITPSASDAQRRQLEKTAVAARDAMRESTVLEAKVRRMDQQVAAAQAVRDQLMDLIALARDAWAETQSELNQDAVESAKLQTEIQRASSELAQLAGVKNELEMQEPPTVAVEHLPTPMAKTVFGDEIHFRLHEGRLSIVPISPLVDAIEADLRRATGSAREGRTIAAVGPIRGYVAHYASDRQVGRINVDGRVRLGTRVSLAAMTIEPLKEPVGQPLDEVINGRSMLDVELAGRDPGATTITIWVYPDDFAGLRQLKEHLYRRGFATAARPLQRGAAITGGPGGRKSRSQ
ncbi:MAG: hypothetical protein AAGJ40_01440 [Planctomycetota bacterium]